MSKPALLQVSYCVFLHEQNDQPLLRKLYRRLRPKYDAQDLSTKTILATLKHCNNHYGLFITANAHELLRLLRPFSHELQEAKIWVINLGEAINEATPTYVEHLKTPEKLSNRTTLAFKELKREIKLAMLEMRQHLTATVREQKPTAEQEGLAFLDRLNFLFESHFVNSKLRTSFIAAEMGVSVSTLERKCEKLTGKLPGQLLTQFRLEKARLLILTTRMRMSDIAQQTGFTSASYFSVRFAEHFGHTPSQSRALQHKNAS